MTGEKGLSHISAGVSDVLETLHGRLVEAARGDVEYRHELWERGWMWVTASVEAGGVYPARVERLPEHQRAMVGFQLALSHYRDAVLKLGATPTAKLALYTEAKAACQSTRKELTAALERLVASYGMAMMHSMDQNGWESADFERIATEGLATLTPLGAQ